MARGQVPRPPRRPGGSQAGSRELATNVYELEPGAVGSPLHLHHANEKLLLVLEGSPSLRGPDGTQILPAGAVVAFPRGEAGAHSLVNRSEKAVRYLVVSTTNSPDVVEYPDIGATLVVLGERRLAYPRGAGADRGAAGTAQSSSRPTQIASRMLRGPESGPVGDIAVQRLESAAEGA